jgi:hypothetical protein
VNLQKEYVQQDRRSYDTLAPRIEKLMETSDHYDEDQEQDIRDRLNMWEARILIAEEALGE